MSAIEVKFGKSFHPDAATAVQELVAQVSGIEPNFLIFFCSPKYDHVALGKAIAASFTCPVIGCTTAGEILSGEGYIEGAIVCAAVASSRISLRIFPIPDVIAFAGETDESEAELEAAFSSMDREKSFAILLIDGLSMMEELVIGRINKASKGIPQIGASAGDGLNFQHTYVYYEGAFHENAAVLAFFETTLPFMPLHIQHFESTDMRIVITDADPATRTVMEINGLPACEGYAHAIDLAPEKLTPQVFAAHPLMLRIGGRYYVRSIQKANPDGSLTFYCAIATGVILTVAKPVGKLSQNLENSLTEIQKTMKPALILGSDCILRRLEMQRNNELEEMKHLLSRFPFIGFSTYGEQYYGVHVNHTLTALVLGDEA